jgi:hypothetical protein
VYSKTKFVHTILASAANVADRDALPPYPSGPAQCWFPPPLRFGPATDPIADGQMTAWATMTSSPLNVAAGEPYSKYPSVRASLTLWQNAASSGPVSMRYVGNPSGGDELLRNVAVRRSGDLAGRFMCNLTSELSGGRLQTA